MKYIWIKEIPFPQYIAKGEIADEEIVGEYSIVEIPDYVDLSQLHYKHFDSENLFLPGEYINTKKKAYRSWRSICLHGFDILKTNVAVGLISPLTAEEIQWYEDVLSFTSLIKEETTEDDYPTIPTRIVAYIKFYD